MAALAVEGLKAGRLAILRDAFGTLPAAVAAATAGIRPPAHVPATAFGRLAELDLTSAERVARGVRSAGVDILCWDDPRYPAPLWSAPQAPPALLYLQGTLPATYVLPAHRVRAAAVVGTRRPTGRGRALARELATALAALGVTVVSGLALGIDAAAHEGALDGDGPTVAVLGGGHGRLHPPSHRGLARRILEADGAILSEHPPDRQPERHAFPNRNRLVSGLARLVVVVEAALQSGTASTVDHAIDQHRDVFACPGRPGDPSVAGTLRYLRDGALIVSELEDVLFRFRHGAGHASAVAGRGSGPLGAEDDALLATLYGSEEATLDDLVARLDIPVAPLMVRLTRLELRGAVVRTAAGHYRLGADERRRRAVAEERFASTLGRG